MVDKSGPLSQPLNEGGFGGSWKHQLFWLYWDYIGSRVTRIKGFFKPMPVNRERAGCWVAAEV